VNLNLGNAAESNMVTINAAHIAYVRLSGSMSSASRKLEINLTSGAVIGMSFDDPEYGERVFAEVMATINRTIPDNANPRL
jgi:hypothetical protein